MIELTHTSTWPPSPIAVEIGRRLRLVARRMNHVIMRQEYSPSYLQMLRLALRQPGKLLGCPSATGHPLPPAMATLHSVPVLIAHATASATMTPEAPMALWRSISPIAAAAEFLGLALDTVQAARTGQGDLALKLGTPMLLNCALTFFALTHAALADEQTPNALLAPLHELFATSTARLAGQLALSPTHPGACFSTFQRSLPLYLQAGAMVGAYPAIKPLEADLPQSLATGVVFGELGLALCDDPNRAPSVLRKLSKAQGIEASWLRGFAGVLR